MRNMLASLLLLSALNACVSARIKWPPVQLEAGEELLWFSAVEGLPRGSVVLSTEIQKGHRDPFRFQGVFENNGDAVSLVGMTPLGTRAFSQEFDEYGNHYDALPFYRMPIKAEKLLFYWLVASMPLENVQANLQGLRVSETPDGVRQVKRGQHLVASIQRQGSIAKPRFEITIPHRKAAKTRRVLFQVHQQDFDKQP
ncbi:DUF3261 domain-containing protein [Acanthopleuribacter pedis]|uniref:DUF3261 domain-containing protein n=1 Tax=Acanthopleuribacter pedis TaxID=442870 RepID=A0A8J7QIJ0_9BACT|nr:DUF3261 domain-containing protein [Acanthopleuribacter pedis]MBO1323025.1 DUF3261 domain-containing protein [Acanthopleuribacter pedis]